MLVCVKGSRGESRGKRLCALLLQSIAEVELSSKPSELVAPELTILLDGWGDLDAPLALRECQLRFATPVIIVVPQRRAALVPELLRAGAADCVRLPVSDAELLARVETRLSRARAEIALDAVTLTLNCNAVRVRLTRSEFRVVRHLLWHPSRWSTSDEMTIVALRSSGSSKNLLRGLVHSIRRKLQHEAWRLLSDRRLGYRFELIASQVDVDADELKARE